MSNYTKLDEYKQQIADFFNARKNYDSSKLANLRASRFLELLSLNKGDKVLDIATGTGLIGIPIAEIVGDKGKVIGVDIASVLLQQAQEKIDVAGLKNIELIEADAEDLIFDDNSFDAVLCCSAIMVFKNIYHALNSWYHFLKPGGIVAFNAYSENSSMTPEIIEACSRCDIVLPNIHEPLGTPQKCENILIKAGFHNIEVTIEQFGKYIPFDDAKNIFDGSTWIHPENPLRQISSEKRELLRAEFINIVKGLVTEKGVWRDITTFFVKARK